MVSSTITNHASTLNDRSIQFNEHEVRKDNVVNTIDYNITYLYTDKVIQLSILSLCCYLTLKNDLLFYGLPLLKILIVFTMGSFLSFNNNFNNLWKFDTVYLFLLPLLMSFYFQTDCIFLNTILTFNSFDISYLSKLLLQLYLLYSINGTFTTQVIPIFINSLLCSILAKIGDYKSFDNIDCNLFSIFLTNLLFLNDSKELIYNNLFKALMFSLINVITINYTIIKLLKLTKIEKNFKYLRSVLLSSNILITFPLLVKNLVIEGQDPLIWLINFISTSIDRQKILFTWLLALLILIPNIMMNKSKFSLNTSRKVWHFLIIVLLVYPFKIDPLFVKISLAGSIVLFLIVEYTRYLKLDPIGNQLDLHLRSFTDFRDENGPVIISYIYLIVGVSTPLLLSDSPIGLVGLGIGDSIASIVGKKIGTIKWPGTSKTVEGTVAFILSTMLTCHILKEYLGYFTDISTADLFKICTLSGILEGNSVLNDNILIPTFMLICERIFARQ
ncbi:hypothetical protein Kpol_1056p11 [Vanderwaltozyma polyspora DSM 70294]|uniref:dolichol kinase n=1 Tax=Vanderwaltozyma polyspora (strain ATCC 22028 / DSM 70294 / BCRC 21397 / CBS 2163 / NBRC 10782 / NRRL Y-8283 / UCD 57-17) TaxID=436907 RepID=A7TLL8_VANPO|nr:uncharacterized protein Kpol_1056p11 [Vanderwaltozyma polyspora DSM 70294]EDO16810.1 hypothetical protein Kpol_1056p11 [Vanderwaltozyma polyspora DSM 70294]